MIKVTKAYRDSGGTLQSGSVTTLSRYDGLNRRIEKKVQNSADLDCTYGYYYDRMSMIEARNGSSQTIQQYVWGLDYIDELVQVSNNTDPTTDNTCETSYWACIDANFNVSRLVGVIGTDENSQPVYGAVERYEYTPYGQRTVFFSAGSNDPDCYAPTLISRRVTDGTTIQPYGLCPIGHQGLVQDEESGLIVTTYRYLHPIFGIWMQRDPLGYVNGGSLYRDYAVISFLDPLGLWTRDHWTESEGIATAECDCGESLEALAALITEAGDSGLLEAAKDDKLSDGRIKKGGKVKIIPLLKKFEATLRKNVAGATGGFNADFGLPQTPSQAGQSYSDYINSYFGGGGNITDCLGAARLVMSKGLIDTIGASDFNNLGRYPLKTQTLYGLAIFEA